MPCCLSGLCCEGEGRARRLCQRYTEYLYRFWIRDALPTAQAFSSRFLGQKTVKEQFFYAALTLGLGEHYEYVSNPTVQQSYQYLIVHSRAMSTGPLISVPRA